MHKRNVVAVHGMTFELRGKPVMGAVAFRHDQKAGRVLVNPVHDAGAFLTAHTRKCITTVKEQRIDQRA